LGPKLGPFEGAKSGGARSATCIKFTPRFWSKVPPKRGSKKRQLFALFEVQKVRSLAPLKCPNWPSKPTPPDATFRGPAGFPGGPKPQVWRVWPNPPNLGLELLRPTLPDPQSRYPDPVLGGGYPLPGRGSPHPGRGFPPPRSGWGGGSPGWGGGSPGSWSGELPNRAKPPDFLVWGFGPKPHLKKKQQDFPY
jgi:hypothetical protein